MFCVCKNDPDRDIQKSATILKRRLGALKPRIAVVLGSGLGGLADKVENPIQISYADLPGFPRPGVQGHAGMVVAGTVENVPVVFLKGRAHFYEGLGPAPLKAMMRTMKRIGIETVFLSNAAGSLREDVPPGGLMAIADHLNLSGTNPLQGHNDDEWGPRFVPMGDAWDKGLLEILLHAARTLDIPLVSGTYAWFLGPTFETHAEIRMAKTLGADSVGMSTVPDCIIARHCGLNVVGCSAITNMGAGLSDEKLSHDHTLKQADAAGRNFVRLVVQFLKDWNAQA